MEPRKGGNHTISVLELSVACFTLGKSNSAMISGSVSKVLQTEDYITTCCSFIARQGQQSSLGPVPYRDREQLGMSCLETIGNASNIPQLRMFIYSTSKIFSLLEYYVSKMLGLRFLVSNHKREINHLSVYDYTTVLLTLRS